MDVAEVVVSIVPPSVRALRLRRWQGWRLVLVLTLGVLAVCGAPVRAQGVAGVVDAQSEASRPVAFDAADALIVQAWQGYKRGDPQAAQDALPQLRGNLLEPWVAYWAIQPTLSRMTEADFDAFSRAYPSTYVLDRLRDDWLLELGRRQDWEDFAQVYPDFIMRDDPQVKCYDLQRQFETQGLDTSSELLPLWTAQRAGGPGCNSAAQSLLAAGKISQRQLWTRVRRFFEDEQFKAALSFAPSLPVGAWHGIHAAATDPLRLVLDAQRQGVPRQGMQRQFLILALLRLAEQDPQQTMRLLGSGLSGLPGSDRVAVAYQAARSGAVQLLPDAALWFSQARRFDTNYRPTDSTLEWMVRAALRAHDWTLVDRASRQFTADTAQRADWTYWHATAQRELGHPIEAEALYAQIASPWSYYGQLATEGLGMKISLPASLSPPSAQDVRQQAATPGFQRALALFRLNIYQPAVREWNFSLRGLDNDAIHAAAQVACDQQVWLLCINTSERVRGGVDWSQRYAMPYREAISRAAKSSGVGEAFLFGLIRQESRFIAGIRSWVGANGLMQLMPTTARWVARKIGMGDYTPEHITQVDTNVTLGSAYLDMLLQRFDGSEAMAAAGYNAGPGRPARWRNMGVPDRPDLSGAIFAENIPIPETRDYVKHVLANATVYAALITGQPQSLKSRLGTIGPAEQQQASAAPLP
ncbi:lytic transglycosylase domain-containing protein [Thiomonas sp. FB-Cd]|uniref:lytic transglycosylase domain-containing protein n=1 Tax=Thiomonas sp. FB-Cd TaxID=1158292 RepID=UPI000689C226|nr:lytic transglycosylase domain-containing protein [Thiomonas sp. FB-Cd]